MKIAVVVCFVVWLVCIADGSESGKSVVNLITYILRFLDFVGNSDPAFTRPSYIGKTFLSKHDTFSNRRAKNEQIMLRRDLIFFNKNVNKF